MIGENTSAPRRLLYSPGVQELLSLLSKLQGPTKDSSLQVMLSNIPKVVENVSEQEMPSDLESDFEEALESMPDFMERAKDLGPLLKRFCRLKVVQRVPEIAERLAPFEILYPEELAKQSQVGQEELKQAFRKAAAEYKDASISSWNPFLSFCHRFILNNIYVYVHYRQLVLVVCGC